MSITLDGLKASLHDVAIKDSTNGYELSIDSNGKITAIIEDGGGSITVDGTVAATQSGVWSVGLDTGAKVIITDGTDDLAIDASGNIGVTQATSPWVVSATDLDIRDLSASQDNVAISDGTDTLAVNADGSINVNAFEAGYSTWKVTQATVTTTESELVSTPLTNRLSILIQNTGPQDVYLREQTGVTTANGLLLNKGSSFEANLDDGADIYAITGSSTSDLRIVEYAA